MLEARKASLEERHDILDRETASGFRDDIGDGYLAPALVWTADDSGLEDHGATAEDVLDLGGIDVLAAGDHHVFHPVVDVVEPLGIAMADVARAEPAVRERGCRRRRIVPVFAEKVRAA